MKFTNLNVTVLPDSKICTETLSGQKGFTTPAQLKTIIDTGNLKALNNLSELTNKASARVSLELGSAATLSFGSNPGNLVRLDISGRLPAVDGSQITGLNIPSGGLQASNNLSDLSNVNISKSNLGLGSAANRNDSYFETVLGNPPFDNYILGSSAAGVRFWLSPAASGASEPILGNPPVDGYVLSSTMSGVRTWASKTIGSSGDLISTNNLSDLTSISNARTNLGLGTAATQNSSSFEQNLSNPSTDGLVLSSTALGVRSWISLPSGGGAGLVNFSESISSAGVNAARPVIALLPSASGYHDVVIGPKDGGSMSMQIPDGFSQGGNKRGYYAVDFQSVRSNNSYVASGNSSALLSGSNNTASADNSVVAGGDYNKASGYASSVISGDYNQSQGSRSSVVGGNTNTSAGPSSFIGGGNNNTASGNRSSVISGSYNISSGNRSSVISGEYNIADGEFSLASGKQSSSKNVYGASVRSSGGFSFNGDAQKGLYILRNTTNNSDQKPLFLDGVSQRLNLSGFSTYAFSGMVAARSSNGTSSGWRFTGTIKRGAELSSTTIVGMVIGTPDMDSGAVGWGLSIAANTTTGSLEILVTGAISTDINWVATVETCEVGKTIQLF